MKAVKIVEQLLKNGVIDLPKWPKDEFVCAAIQEFNICGRTAEKVFNLYHEALNKRCQTEMEQLPARKGA